MNEYKNDLQSAVFMLNSKALCILIFVRNTFKSSNKVVIGIRVIFNSLQPQNKSRICNTIEAIKISPQHNYSDTSQRSPSNHVVACSVFTPSPGNSLVMKLSQAVSRPLEQSVYQLPPASL